MAVYERRGSGDFTLDSGKILFVVLEAEDQTAAVEEAMDDPAAVEQYGDFLLSDVSVSDQGNGVFFVDLDYRRGVPGPAGPGAGSTPGEARPAPAGQNHSEPLPRDVEFTIGFDTKHITQLPPGGQTLHRIAKPGDTAPDFGGLIWVNADGTVQGCDIKSPTSSFSITKKYGSISLGFFRHLLDCVATTNNAPFLGTDTGECLFVGASGHFKDGDPTPWTVTGRWEYSRNYENVVVGELTLPTVPGHSYIWFRYVRGEETVTIDGQPVKVIVEYPRWGYVELPYAEAAHDTLGFN